MTNNTTEHWSKRKPTVETPVGQATEKKAPKYSDRQIRVNNVDPDQTAPSSMIRVFCLHLLGPLPYGRTTLLKIYDYYSSCLGCPNVLGGTSTESA